MPQTPTIKGPLAASPATCEAILRSLPEWFGIETSLLNYAKSAALLPTWTATVDGEVVAFLSVVRHFPASAEVHCVAVHARQRGRGIGRALLGEVERWLAADGVRLLQVKTLGPSRPDAHYELTRRFYERYGFVALEEFKDLWPGNPCLLLAKPIAGL
jgi:GNAT superfamily N-acetyltransferase